MLVLVNYKSLLLLFAIFSCAIFCFFNLVQVVQVVQVFFLFKFLFSKNWRNAKLTIHHLMQKS